MSIAVILPVYNNSKNFVPTIDSILKNSKTPNTICFIANSDIDMVTDAEIKAFIKNCCDKSTFSEEYNKDYTVSTKVKDGCKFVYIKINPGVSVDIRDFALKYLKNSVDIVITARVGGVYSSDYIEKYSDKLSDGYVGAVYSDYIKDNKYIYLSHIHPMLSHHIEIADIGFKTSYIENYTRDNADTINTIYAKSLVRHIPEALMIL